MTDTGPEYARGTRRRDPYAAPRRSAAARDGVQARQWDAEAATGVIRRVAPARAPAAGCAAPNPEPVRRVPYAACASGRESEREGVFCATCRRAGDCCFCAADVEDMRRQLGRIAELHSACSPPWCPERRRLSEIRRYTD